MSKKVPVGIETMPSSKASPRQKPQSLVITDMAGVPEGGREGGKEGRNERRKKNKNKEENEEMEEGRQGGRERGSEGGREGGRTFAEVDFGHRDMGNVAQEEEAAL